MEKYSEKQLLMLSNFVYLAPAAEEGTISEILSDYKSPDGTFTTDSVYQAGIGGGLTGEEVRDLFTMMDEECTLSPSFAQLSVSRRLDEEDVRAFCYTDKQDENPVVVFRGTGGTKEAWRDNVYGAYNDNTRLQNTADEFIKYECSVYDDITVTGHSKGGNLSQYVTVMNEEKVSRCISFDGQGFNNEFIGNHAAEIARSAPKIKSVCAYNDYVNVLLTAIAGTVMFVKNEEDGVNAHSSYWLLKSNEYDENGDFKEEEPQSFVTKIIHGLSDSITSVIDFMEEADKFILCTLLGDTVTGLVGAQGKDGVADALKSAGDEGMSVIYTKMNSVFADETGGIKDLPSGGFYFDCKGVENIVDCFGQHLADTKRISNKIAELKDVCDYGVTERIYSNMALERIMFKIDEIDRRMNSMTETMAYAVRRYKAKEMFIAARMGSHNP